MSDASESMNFDPAGTAPSPAATPSAAPAPAPPVAADDVLASELPADQAVFDRGWVDKLRNEGRRYREEARTSQAALDSYNNVFGVYDDDDRQTWLDLAATWAQDPARAAQVMAEIAKGVLDENAGGGQVGARSTPGASDAEVVEELSKVDTSGMTAEQVQQMIAEAMSARDQAVIEQRAIENIYGEVRAAGYDPESRWGIMVLHAANHETNGDIGEAVKLVQADRQAIIDEYVSGRAAGNRAVPSPAGGAAANTTPEPITSFDDARRAADAYLRGTQMAQPG